MESEHMYDVLILGAGLSGICTLHHIRQRFPTWRIVLLEAGSSVGGTWYWNRYPQARFDSESLSYAFSFDQEIIDQWHWTESFSPQTETLKYIDYVATKLDLTKDMRFNTRIVSATWQDSKRVWTFVDETKNQYEARFFISCVGFLSEPTLPAIPGVKSFQGQAFHTSRWPESLDYRNDFKGKRVGIIGTGATGIQTITAIAKESDVQSLHVFQRTANWSAPLRNTTISPEQMAKYRQGYADIWQSCANTPTGFLHMFDPRRSLELTQAERVELWEKLYAEPGFGKWLGVFIDTYTDREANKLYSDFMAQKIRDRVHDPAVAESLVPKNHGFGTRRVPLESGYFEVYNQPNVHLVDLQKSPIECIKEKVVKTSTEEIELDVLIYATGFDAITGAFNAIQWKGKDGRQLIGKSGDQSSQKAIWLDHQPRTYLGLTVPDMPNMLMVLGPHQPFGNATRSIEHAVQVITELLSYCEEKGYTYVVPTQSAVDAWGEHVAACGAGALFNEVDSWITGVNKNVEGKSTRTVARYAGSVIEYRRRCEEVRQAGWTGLTFA